MTTTTNERIRFMDNNLAELTTAGTTFSSALAAFPSTNLTNKFRSKVWKPSGLFEIIAGTNDKLYINDGVDKTITLTASSTAYTAPAFANLNLNVDPAVS